MYLFYTGNVKLEDREDYDYINTGREANTVLVTSRDGEHFSKKKLLMKNTDYPSDLTLHVRDPKVWKQDVSTICSREPGQKKMLARGSSSSRKTR